MKLHSPSVTHFSYWVAACAVGILAVLYAKFINFVQFSFNSAFHQHQFFSLLAIPFAFLIAAFLVKQFAPEAGGSGIPQVLEAIEHSKHTEKNSRQANLVSIRTAIVKVLSSAVGILGGASVGREGPTVQIASSVFAWTANRTKSFVSRVDQESYLIAGGAAGVAAAFNTPLAGITFALEEIAETMFAHHKQTVMLAVIIAGITAQALIGDYLYFGHPITQHATWNVLPEALGIGIAGGIFGGIFSYLLAHDKFKFLPQRWWLKALSCGLICSGIAYLSNGDSAGSGYEVTKQFMDAPSGSLPQLFPLFKFFATILSYVSGMAGGIFSPCLSIGSGLGFTIGKIASVSNLKVCALIGMVSFFSGVVRAPLTSVIIVMEMTDEHILILPFMIAAFLAHGIGKFFMPIPLYRFLATRKNQSSP